MNSDHVFDRLVEELTPAGAVDGKMFGARAITLQQKAFACLKNDQIALKLGADTPEHAAALALPGAELWDPSGKHKPFKDWVALGLDQDAELSDLAASALEYLAGTL